MLAAAVSNCSTPPNAERRAMTNSRPSAPPPREPPLPRPSLATVPAKAVRYADATSSALDGGPSRPRDRWLAPARPHRAPGCEGFRRVQRFSRTLTPRDVVGAHRHHHRQPTLARSFPAGGVAERGGGVGGALGAAGPAPSRGRTAGTGCPLLTLTSALPPRTTMPAPVAPPTPRRQCGLVVAPERRPAAGDD